VTILEKTCLKTIPPKINSRHVALLIFTFFSKIIENLGGEIVTDVRECTHLITNKIRKTFKFLSCLARSVHIIGDRWLEESNKNKMFLSK